MHYLEYIAKGHVAMHTVNGERFAGLNFRVFHGFQKCRESFSVNISASL